MANKQTSFPPQTFQLECLMDRGYRFLRQDGDDVMCQFKGLSGKVHTIRIKPNGDKFDEPSEE